MEKRTFKRTGQISGIQKNFRKYSEYAIDDAVIGKFVGTHEDVKYKKTAWMIEVADAQWKDNKAADAIIGKTLVMNAAGQLDKAMKVLPVGQWVEIIYTGKEKITAGEWAGSDGHTFAVHKIEDPDSPKNEPHHTDAGWAPDDDGEILF